MFYKEDPPNFLLKGGQTIDLGRRSPWWGGRQEGTSDNHNQCWSQFLVGFIHPVWWHPPDDGRQCMVVAVASLQHRLVPIQASLLCEGGAGGDRGVRAEPKAPPKSEDSKMEALVAIKGKEELCSKCERGPPRTCKIVFMLLFFSFRFLFRK